MWKSRPSFTDDEEFFEKGRKIASMWSVCSDVYLAPVYSDCTENVEELLEADMAEWMTEEWRNKQQEVEGCMLLKQSKYYYKVRVKSLQTVLT